MLIVNVFDSVYATYTEGLVASFRSFHNGSKAYIHCVNPDAETEVLIEAWREQGLCVSTEFREFVSNDARLDELASRRAYFLAELFTKVPEGAHIWYLDSDSLIRKRVPPLPDNVEIAAFSRPAARNASLKYLLSTAYFKNTPNTREFVQRWCTILDSLRRSKKSIMTIQAAFYHASLQMRPKLEVYPLALSYNDWTFNRSSCVWCGKGMGKLSVPFLNEMTRFVGQLQLSRMVRSFSLNEQGPRPTTLMAPPHSGKPASLSR